MLRVWRHDVVFQEVPDEISLALTLSGCPLRCPGCHSAHTWNPERGETLTQAFLDELLGRYAGLIDCVLFLGGDWQPAALEKALRQVRATGLKTCLYSGYDSVPETVFRHLTYLKTGPWIAARGGLDTPGTNQRFIDCRDGRCLNYRFWRKHAYPERRTDSTEN